MYTLKNASILNFSVNSSFLQVIRMAIDKAREFEENVERIKLFRLVLDKVSFCLSVCRV